MCDKPMTEYLNYKYPTDEAVHHGDFGEEGVDRTVHVCECIKDRCILVVTGCAHKHAEPLALQLEGLGGIM